MKPPKLNDPCPLEWNDLRGHSRLRFCEQCQFHVRNLSTMSRRDIQRVLSRAQSERICVTYLRSPDGSLVTRAAFVRERMIAPFRHVFSWIAAAFVPVALGACSSQPVHHSRLMGYIAPGCQIQQKAVPDANMKNDDLRI